MTIAKLKIGSWLTIVFVFLATSCGVINTQTGMTATPTTLTMTPSSLLVSTSTLIMPTNTYTPVPTLSVEERENLVTQLLTQDYHCMLPCWGGIEPGVTTWPDAKVFLEQFAQIYSSRPEIYTAEFQYEGENLVLAFYTYNNIVEFMGAPRFEYPLYRLLQDYGKPDEVYFYILDVLPIDTNNPYTVYLFYKEKGIVAVYSGASVKGTTLSVCFRDAQGRKNHNTFLWLWSKGADKAFHDVTAQDMNKFSDHLSLKYYKLEELSTFQVNDFFELYKLEENENYCLQIKNPNPTPS